MSVSIGQQLRQMRQAKNLSLEQVSRATYIRVSYLEAIEAGQLDRLPSLAQARGFLRTYAKHLGLESETLFITEQDDEPDSYSEQSEPESPPPTPPPTDVFFFINWPSFKPKREKPGV
jgi:cytoskeletal protein RodZ